MYKLIGPALIRQDMVEAKSNVQKRMDYIKGEMERIDNLLKNLESKANDKEAEVRAGWRRGGQQPRNHALTLMLYGGRRLLPLRGSQGLARFACAAAVRREGGCRSRADRKRTTEF